MGYLGWFPTEELAVRGIFWVVFGVVFSLIVISFKLYFRVTGQKYNDLLERYKWGESKP